MNSFMAEVGPYLESLANVEKDVSKLILDSQNKLTENTSLGCGCGCCTSLLFGTIVVGSASIGAILIIAPVIIGLCIGYSLDLINRKTVKKNIQKEKVRIKKFNIGK